MKKAIISLMFVACFAIVLWLAGCGEKKSDNDGNGSNSTEDIYRPLNLTVFLDLSDRLDRDLTPTQAARDTELINFCIDEFIDISRKETMQKTSNHFKVVFYPTPDNPLVSDLANDLEVDLNGLDENPGEKKRLLKEMKVRFDKALDSIYTSTLRKKQWVGCDIWSFFSNKKVDNLCMREGCRNVVIILTDGYLFHQANKQVEGTAFTFVLPQTLQNPKSSLIVRRDGLKDLEILMLEVNPYSPTQHDQLFKVLTDWFTAMGIEKFQIEETDIPSNIKPVISNFLAQ